MKFGKIPKKFLNTVLGETWDGEYTLKTELESIGEDVIDFKAGQQRGKLNFFLAWTEHYAIIMVDTPFGDQALIAAPRNPITRKAK